MTVFFLRLQERSALLKKEVSGNKLVNELSPEENEIIKIKSKMLNKVITDFIQKQL